MKKISFYALIVFLSFNYACNKKNNTPEPEPSPAPTPGPSYSIPTSYNFSNATFTNSSTRINMLGELVGYIRSTHTTTSTVQPTLSAQKMKDMFANAANQFTDNVSNNSGIQLKDQCGTAFAFLTDVDAYFSDAQLASTTAAVNPTTTTASSGVSGKLVSSTRAVLVNANGYEYKELVEKGVMGALFYYQGINIINNIAGFDNSTQINGSTLQEKKWDEAFGYFGVPITFPTSTVGLKYWGTYCNSVSSAIGSNSLIMNAFLKGRAAISNKDNAARDEAKTDLIKNWEKVGAAKCISYLKSAKSNLLDNATLHHNLSEAHGFILAFKYNPAKTISDSDITTLLGYLGNNLFNLVPTNIDLAISKLESVFNLNATLIP